MHSSITLLFLVTIPEIFPPIKPVKPKFFYFYASDKEMWKVIYIYTITTDRTIRYFNIMEPLVFFE